MIEYTMIVCWCDFMAWHKNQSDPKDTKTKNNNNNIKAHTQLQCCRNENGVRFILLSQVGWRSKNCHWRILSRFLHCLWTFYRFSLFALLFVCMSWCVHVCVCMFVYVTCKTNKTKMLIIFFPLLEFTAHSKQVKTLLFAWINWLNLNMSLVFFFLLHFVLFRWRNSYFV